MSATVDPQYVIQLQGKQYVQVVGLVDAAHQAGLKGIISETRQVAGPDNGWHAVVAVTVIFTSGDTWTATGDADPSTTKLRAYERLAETRALGRALRWKLNVAELTVEELPDNEPAENGATTARPAGRDAGAGNGVAAPAGRQPAVPAGVRDAGGTAVGEARLTAPPAQERKCQAKDCGAALTEKQWNDAVKAGAHPLCRKHQTQTHISSK